MMLLLAGGLAGALALTGCGKKETPTPAPMGVTVDMPKLQQAFANTTPDLQAAVSEVAMGVRYTDYPRAFAGLAKLDSAPGLTEPQKKMVATMTEQVKQLAGKAAAPPAQ